MKDLARLSQFSLVSDANSAQPIFETVAASPRLAGITIPSCDNAKTAEGIHDLRNILSTISMLSELALMDLPDTTPVSATLLQIRAACVDANELCNRILDTARVAPKSIERVNLPTLVMAIAPLLRTYIPADSALRFDLHDDTPLIDAAPGAIRQVVMNLVKNAAESLGDGAGAVTLSTGLVSLDGLESDDTLCMRPLHRGQYSYLAVLDTGCGMDEATKAQLFESSFTTKASGHGLGTASIRRIMDDCGGRIQVQSRVGGGTQIRLLFPLSIEPIG